MKQQVGKLMHWVNRAKAGNGPKIRLMTADDDFLNVVGAFEKQAKQMILVRDGGHYGYRGDMMVLQIFRASIHRQTAYLFQ